MLTAKSSLPAQGGKPPMHVGVVDYWPPVMGFHHADAQRIASVSHTRQNRSNGTVHWGDEVDSAIGVTGPVALTVLDLLPLSRRLFFLVASISRAIPAADQRHAF